MTHRSALSLLRNRLISVGVRRFNGLGALARLGNSLLPPSLPSHNYLKHRPSGTSFNYRAETQVPTKNVKGTSPSIGGPWSQIGGGGQAGQGPIIPATWVVLNDCPVPIISPLDQPGTGVTGTARRIFVVSLRVQSLPCHFVIVIHAERAAVVDHRCGEASSSLHGTRSIGREALCQLVNRVLAKIWRLFATDDGLFDKLVV